MNRRLLPKLSLLGLGLLLIATACATPAAQGTPTPTTTATAASVALTPTTVGVGQQAAETATPVLPTDTPSPTPPSGLCPGLSGTIETWVRPGAVQELGMEPFAVGEIPFEVTTDAEPYAVAGEGNINYADTLQQEWGSFQIDLRMTGGVQGTCTEAGDAGELALTITLAGDQATSIKSEEVNMGFDQPIGDNFDVTFPIEEGAAVDGEGWAFILHLD